MQATGANAEPSEVDGLKVMVIDDSNTIRRSAEIFLLQAGCQVILAEDGFDALAKINDFRPDMIFCDIPQVPAGPLGKFMLTQMAAVAELEAGLIGQRTKAALQAAKERGVKLGGYRGEKAAKAAAAAKTANADANAARLRDTVKVIQAAGITSASGIAKELNRRGVTTAKGGAWQTVQTQRLLARLG